MVAMAEATRAEAWTSDQGTGSAPSAGRTTSPGVRSVSAAVSYKVIIHNRWVYPSRGLALEVVQFGFASLSLGSVAFY